MHSLLSHITCVVGKVEPALQEGCGKHAREIDGCFHTQHPALDGARRGRR